MDARAHTPEELETLFEDAFVLRDRAQLCALFDAPAVMARGDGDEARGPEAIGRAASDLWAGGRAYVGGARRVLQADDTALVVSIAGIHVARRDRDGAWRLAISLLDLSDPPGREMT